MRSSLLLLVAAALSSGAAGQAPEARPVIGILTHPSSNETRGHSYIAASYVKWLESGGARVVPILYDLPEASLRTLLESLNGALFTGGEAAFIEKDGVTLTQYAVRSPLHLRSSVSASMLRESVGALCLFTQRHSETRGRLLFASARL